VFLVVTVETQCFQVLEVICHRRIAKVLLTQVFLVMYNISRNDLAFSLAPLAQAAAVSEISITTVLPRWRVIESFRYRSHVLSPLLPKEKVSRRSWETFLKEVYVMILEKE
jgi:hypothetical protein